MAFCKQVANRAPWTGGLLIRQSTMRPSPAEPRPSCGALFAYPTLHFAYAPVEMKIPEVRLSPEGKMATLLFALPRPLLATVEICRLFNNPAGNQRRFPLAVMPICASSAGAPTHPAAECGNKWHSGGQARSPPPQLTKS